MLAVIALGACGHKASTTTGQAIYNDFFSMCIRSRSVVEKFQSFADMEEYCSCRAYYLAQNTTFEEHRDMVRAEFETGLTKVSARVANEAEAHCQRN